MGRGRVSLSVLGPARSSAKPNWAGSNAESLFLFRHVMISHSYIYGIRTCRLRSYSSRNAHLYGLIQQNLVFSC